MTESDGSRTPARPRQVTVAGVMVVVACLLLVLTLFEAMAGVRSADTRKGIVEFLAKPPGDGLSLTVDGVIELLRGLLLLSGALAAAGVVLGVYALLRHRGARIGLSVVAVLMLFSATFVSVLPVVVAVAAAMLWGREARDWFDGRTPQPRPVPDTTQARPAPEMTSWQPDPDADAAGQRSTPPPSAHPFATPQAPPGQHAAAPLGPMGYAQRPMSRPPGRPAAVTAAVWLAWVFSALVAMFFLVAVLVILVDRDQLLAKLQESPSFADRGYNSQEILGFLWVVSAISIFWSLCAMALAALVLRRVEIGRRVLVVSAALAGIFCLLAVPVGWVHAVVAFTCVGLLHSRSTRDWFAGRDVQPPAGPPGPWAGPPGGSSGGPSSWPPPQPPPAEGPPQDKPPVW